MFSGSNASFRGTKMNVGRLTGKRRRSTNGNIWAKADRPLWVLAFAGANGRKWWKRGRSPAEQKSLSYRGGAQYSVRWLFLSISISRAAGLAKSARNPQLPQLRSCKIR
ncbi:hypothetical protein [Sphingomonas natans]|uniref:hypothetical protein n=1 Tax=Sphingomonas natans TaxID=3063330 RepID=UPI0026E42E69|nr:hypothetical protein [Sphingomonas sp. BIUV-7]